MERYTQLLFKQKHPSWMLFVVLGLVTVAFLVFVIDGRPLATQVGTLEAPQQTMPQAQELREYAVEGKPLAGVGLRKAGASVQDAVRATPTGGKSGVLAKKAASASVAGVDTRAKIRWDALKTNTEVAKNSLREVTFPYEGDGFDIKYLPEAQLFAVTIQGVSSWQEYSPKRKQIQDTFFRAQGIDPCTIHILWTTNPFLDSDQPSQGDLGCTTGDFLFPQQ